MRRWALAAVLVAACDGDPAAGGADAGGPDASPTCGRQADELCPVVEPGPSQSPGGAPQPRRFNPTAVAISPDGARAYVTLTGSEAEPGDEVVVIDLATLAVSARIDVGPRPVALAFAPDGRHLVVASSYSRRLAVIDADRGEVVDRPALTFYAEGLAFDPAGAFLLVTDRMHDGLWRVPVDTAGGALRLGPASDAAFFDLGTNPSAIDLCPDGRLAFVAITGDRGVARVDVQTGAQEFVRLNAPPHDVKCLGRVAAVATLGSGSGHPRRGSPECEALQSTYGPQHILCDDTAAIRFSDIQNELAIVDVASARVLERFTSDTAEISAVDPVGEIEPRLMRIAGANPQRLALAGRTLYMTFSASGQVQAMRLPEDPAAWGGQTFLDGPLLSVGFGAQGIAVTPDERTAVVANRLSEDVSVIDLVTGRERRVVVGNVEPPFPATDEEIGELFFFSAYFSADGDSSCSHCHPGATTDGKAWSVATVPVGASRGVPQARNLGRTLPLLLEGTQNEMGFNLEMEDLSPRIDFDPDPTDTYAKGRAARDAFFRDTSRRLFDRSVGFDDMVAKVGRFLVHEPRLLPNPFPDDTPEVLRGRAIFKSTAVGCDACHPIADGFTTREAFRGVIATRPGDMPNTELPDEIALDFRDARRGFFDTPSLRGIWDRPSRFLHDGRARTLAETFLPPEHAALLDGEHGFNFGGGFEPGEQIFDTHGGATQLTPRQVEDLLAFLRTIE